MRFRHVILFLLVFSCLLATGWAQGAKASGTAGPMVWTAFLANSDSLLSVNGVPGLPYRTFSSFTPFADITVTRVQIEAGIGPVVFTGAAYQVCSLPHAIRLTNGSNTYVLPLANPAGFDSVYTGSSTDSGPLEVVFAANTRIELAMLPPPEINYPVRWCDVKEVNVTIQYRSK